MEGFYMIVKYLVFYVAAEQSLGFTGVYAEHDSPSMYNSGITRTESNTGEPPTPSFVAEMPHKTRSTLSVNSAKLSNLPQLFSNVSPRPFFLSDDSFSRISNFVNIFRDVLGIGPHPSARTFPSLLMIGLFGIAELIAVFMFSLALLAPAMLAMMTMIHFMFKSSLIMLG